MAYFVITVLCLASIIGWLPIPFPYFLAALLIYFLVDTFKK